MDAYREIGPTACLGRWEVYRRACEARRLAQQVAELSMDDERQDLPRARALLARIGALVGAPATGERGDD